MSGFDFAAPTEIEHDESHIVEALEDMRFQDKGMPRAEAYVEVIAARWQVVEDLLWQLATERDLDGSVGVQLDGLGDILDERRGGLTDDQYRLFLKAKILVLRSRGRLEELIQILQVLGYSGISVTMHHPAKIEILVCEVTLVDETNRILRLAKAGGVGLYFVFSSYKIEELFTFSDSLATDTLDAARGFRSLPGIIPVTGGRFPDLRTT